MMEETDIPKIKPKSRTWLILIAVVAILCLTNRYWLGLISVPISFEVKGGGDKCKVEVLLNYEDNEEFKKSKHSTQTFDLKKNPHIEMNLRCLKSAKKMRIILSNLDKNQSLSIENLMFYDQKLPIENGEKVRIEKDEEKFTLTYLEPLPVVEKSWNVDYKLMIIIAVFSYLLGKVLVKIVEYHIKEERSMIDVIFLTIIFCFLFFPMSSLNKEEISTQENRTLAKWKFILLPNGNLNFDFGKDFNEYFNDRFRGRNEFIGTYNSIFKECSFITQTEQVVIDKQSDFMYHKGEFNYAKMNLIREEIKELYRFNDWCKEYGIKLYILITPPKSKIYKVNYYIYDKGYHEQFCQYLKDSVSKTDLSIIYPYEEMLKASKENYMYFKTEHHWTDDGAFVGYQCLMQEMVKDFPDIRILTNEDFNYSYNKKIRGDFGRDFNVYGQTINMTGFTDNEKDKFSQTEYRYYTHKKSKERIRNVIDIDFHMNIDFYYPYGANYRVILLGTSMNENLTEFIPYTFKEVRRIRNNVRKIEGKDCFKILKYWGEEIIEYRPNVMIFCITYHNMWSLKDIFNTKD